MKGPGSAVFVSCWRCPTTPPAMGSCVSGSTLWSAPCATGWSEPYVPAQVSTHSTLSAGGRPAGQSGHAVAADSDCPGRGLRVLAATAHGAYRPPAEHE